MNELLINRDSLKAAIESRANYRGAAGNLGISTTALIFKINGKKGRGIVPFTEKEVQTLRSLLGDSILEPAPKPETQKMEARRCRTKRKGNTP